MATSMGTKHLAISRHRLVHVAAEGPTEHSAQDHIQAALEDLQGGESTAHGQPAPVLCHPHSTEGLLVFRGNLLCASSYVFV